MTMRFLMALFALLLVLAPQACGSDNAAPPPNSVQFRVLMENPACRQSPFRGSITLQQPVRCYRDGCASCDRQECPSLPHIRDCDWIDDMPDTVIRLDSEISFESTPFRTCEVERAAAYGYVGEADCPSAGCDCRVKVDCDYLDRNGEGEYFDLTLLRDRPVIGWYVLNRQSHSRQGGVCVAEYSILWSSERP